MIWNNFVSNDSATILCDEDVVFQTHSSEMAEWLNGFVIDEVFVDAL